MADKPLVVGLTGQTGAGKTTVSEAFRKNGYTIINADLVAREVTADPRLVARLGELFGPEVVAEDGTLNRRAMAAKVFSDKDELLKLNTILYPIIVQKIRDQIAELAKAGKKRILLDAPTLFESGANRLCSKTVAVLAEEDRRLFRIMERDHLTEEEARRRISAQPKDSFYKVRASYLLRNDSSPEQLEKDAQPIIDRLEKVSGSSVKSMALVIGSFLLCVLLAWGFFLVAFRIQYPDDYQEEIRSAALEYQVSPSLLSAVIKTGSDFDPDYAENGQRGLFPLTEEQFALACSQTEPLSYESLSDPETSIRCGAALFSLYADEFVSDRAVLAAYYAGAEQTRIWLEDSAYSEDGVDFQSIPDDAVREKMTDVEGARVLYQNLYRLQ